MIEINKDVVYVKGSLNGAIYDFNTKKVYSINDEACKILHKLIANEKILLEKEKEYVTQLIKANLYNTSFKIDEFKFEENNRNELKTVWLEITQSCNLKCVHCYEGNHHKSAEVTLNLQEWKDIIDQLSDMDVKRVVVIGGEPCCHKDLIEILIYLGKKNIETTLFSNGTLFDDKLIEVIKEYNILCKFSLYGHVDEIHDEITKIKGSFIKLVKTINLLKRLDIRVDIAVVAMKENENFQDEIKEFIEQLKIEYKGFDVIRNVYGGNQNNHTPTKKEILESANFSEPSFIAIKQKFINNYYRNSCWHGKIAITETGQVLPCVFERNLTYGNVKLKTLKEILEDDTTKSYWYKTFKEINFCKDCEYRFACKDCRPLALSCKGDISDKNPRCLYNPYTGKWEDLIHEK